MVSPKLLVACLVGILAVGASGFSLTGRADLDFAEDNFSPEELRLRAVVEDGADLVPAVQMIAAGTRSGFDMLNVFFYYDWRNDIMNVGVECDGICGDMDGDGNPSQTTIAGAGIDNPRLCGTESMALMFWPGVPDTWIPNPADSTYFFPRIIVGVDSSQCIASSCEPHPLDPALPALIETCQTQTWNAYPFSGDSATDCPFVPVDPPICQFIQQSKVANPSGQFFPNINLQTKASSTPGYKFVPRPFPIANPNTTHPDIEFEFKNFSNLIGFNYTPGPGATVFGFGGFFGGSSDNYGEDIIQPLRVTIPCGEIDECDVCGGDNSSCADCAGTPNGDLQYDVCGVCGGANDTCQDCFGVPLGPASYDACGICGGDSTTCQDCAGVPLGTQQYDQCGVCGGDDTSCQDCFGVPNGDASYDVCGVCDGDTTTCQDCSGVPNGMDTYDECGVCAGDNTTCQDCFGVPNGDALYDECGVCGGDSTSCQDCSGIPNGGAVYDICGVCDGDGSNCAGCDGVPASGAVYDTCGVCEGDNTSCTCQHYLGYDLKAVDYALLRWTISASLVKINDTLDILYGIKQELPHYDYQSGQLSLVDYIDTLHAFCDECLDSFDFAQVWFADLIAGNCDGVNCGELDLEAYQLTWSI